MTDTAVAVRQPTKMDRFLAQMMTPEARGELAAALPRQVPMERFERNLKNALMQNPDLLDQPPSLVFREVARAAALGLYLDPTLGEAAIVMVYNYRTKRPEPQLRTMTRGLQKLARQSGDVALIYPHEVCERDHFICELGDTKRLIHRADPFSDRGKVIGYYAVVKYKDGEFDFEPMSQVQIATIRDRTESWKAFQAGRIKSTPWASDHDEMAKKTVMRRLMKRVPQSPDIQELLNREDATEHPADAAIDVTPPRPTRASPALVQAPPPVAEIDPVSGESHEPPADDAPSPPTRSQERRLDAQGKDPVDFERDPATGDLRRVEPEGAPETIKAEDFTRDVVVGTADQMAGESVGPTAPPIALPIITVQTLVEGGRGKDWPNFARAMSEAANSLPPEAIEPLILRYKDELAMMARQAAVEHRRLITWLTERARAEPRP